MSGSRGMVGSGFGALASLIWAVVQRESSLGLRGSIRGFGASGLGCGRGGVSGLGVWGFGVLGLGVRL